MTLVVSPRNKQNNQASGLTIDASVAAKIGAHDSGNCVMKGSTITKSGANYTIPPFTVSVNGYVVESTQEVRTIASDTEYSWVTLVRNTASEVYGATISYGSTTPAASPDVLILTKATRTGTDVDTTEYIPVCDFSICDGNREPVIAGMPGVFSVTPKGYIEVNRATVNSVNNVGVRAKSTDSNPSRLVLGSDRGVIGHTESIRYDIGARDTAFAGDIAWTYGWRVPYDIVIDSINISADVAPVASGSNLFLGFKIGKSAVNSTDKTATPTELFSSNRATLPNSDLYAVNDRTSESITDRTIPAGSWLAYAMSWNNDGTSRNVVLSIDYHRV